MGVQEGSHHLEKGDRDLPCYLWFGEGREWAAAALAEAVSDKATGNGILP